LTANSTPGRGARPASAVSVSRTPAAVCRCLPASAWPRSAERGAARAQGWSGRCRKESDLARTTVGGRCVSCTGGGECRVSLAESTLTIAGRTAATGRQFQFAAVECSHWTADGEGKRPSLARRRANVKFQGRPVCHPRKFSPTALGDRRHSPAKFGRQQPVCSGRPARARECQQMAGCSLWRSSPRADLRGERLTCQSLL